MKKRLNLINPDKLEAETKFLNKFAHPIFKGKDVFFFKFKKHIIIYNQEWFTWKSSGKTELLRNQIEIPASAIQWIVDTIEIKFFKPPAEGGLPADQFHHCEVIEGEELCINRSASSGGENIAGYRLVNLNRGSHISSTAKQEFPMPDPFLFEHGLMDYLKELAKDISNEKV